MAKYKITTVNNSVIVQFDDSPSAAEVLDFIQQKQGHISDSIYIKPDRVEMIELVVVVVNPS